jgi:acyl-CoA reductase-like NAD-dependent aldehyde dehydrogenase
VHNPARPAEVVGHAPTARPRPARRGGTGGPLGRALVTHPGVDVVSLTGGVATGRAVMAAAAPRLTPVLLELGGNDAAIIGPDLQVGDQLVEQLVAATYTTY